jgi:hypothetical protein
MGGSLNLEWIFIIKKIKKIKSELTVISKNEIPITPNTGKERRCKKVSLPEEQHVMCVHTIMGTTTTKLSDSAVSKERILSKGKQKCQGSREN